MYPSSASVRSRRIRLLPLLLLVNPACASVTYVTPLGLKVHDPFHRYNEEDWDKTVLVYESTRGVFIDTDRIKIKVGEPSACMLYQDGECRRWVTHEAVYHRDTEVLEIAHWLECRDFHRHLAHELEHAYLDLDGTHPHGNTQRAMHQFPFDRRIEFQVESTLSMLCEE
ncbi:MAG: hypothetical protein AAF654_05835 [Myxococcota bacterium]